MSKTTPDDRDAVLEWLADWIGGENSLWEGGAEVIRDVVDRPDEHATEIEHLVEHDFSHQDVQQSLETADPQDWSYLAEDWEDVRRVRELRQTGLSHMQAIVQAWKEKGLSHESIADETGIPKGTVDVHSRRIGQKVRDARELLDVLSE